MKNRKLQRLNGYDYSQEGVYFITIIIKDREKIFGEIINNEMILNEYGEISKKCWEGIPEHNENIILDEYCIMPNHIHGIIEVRNRHACSLQKKRNIQKIPVVIGSFKSAVTKLINRKQGFLSPTNKIYFQWQKSYHDRIVRNDVELEKIRNYIIENAENWEKDTEFKEIKSKEKFMENDIRVTGVMFYYNFICKRKLWYFSHNISMEQNSEDVEIGKLIDKNTYKREKKQILIDGVINIDFIDGNKVIHEVKKSRAISEAGIWQLKYYLYYLRNKGVEGVTGLIDFPVLKKRERININKDDVIEIEKKLEEIKEVVKMPLVPSKIDSGICKKCSYYELCYI